MSIFQYIIYTGPAELSVAKKLFIDFKLVQRLIEMTRV